MMPSGLRIARKADLTTHYEEERARYNAAFAKFDAVRNQYRARQCGDAEFLAAKNADLIDEIKAYRNRGYL